MNGTPVSPHEADGEEPFPHVAARKHGRAVAIVVNGTKYEPLSKRGLHNIRIFVRCCPCGESHEFHAAGLRIAPCGQRLVIKARKARGTK